MCLVDFTVLSKSSKISYLPTTHYASRMKIEMQWLEADDMSVWMVLCSVLGEIKWHGSWEIRKTECDKDWKTASWNVISGGALFLTVETRLFIWSFFSFKVLLLAVSIFVPYWYLICQSLCQRVWSALRVPSLIGILKNPPISNYILVLDPS